MAKEYGIQIECWFPLGGRDSKGEILRDPVINEIAKSHGKSAAQVIIRWHIQKGFCVVPGSSNPKHIQENIEVFDFELSPEEMAKMASLNQEKRYFNMTYQQIKDWGLPEPGEALLQHDLPADQRLDGKLRTLGLSLPHAILQQHVGEIHDCHGLPGILRQCRCPVS